VVWVKRWSVPNGLMDIKSIERPFACESGGYNLLGRHSLNRSRQGIMETKGLTMLYQDAGAEDTVLLVMAGIAIFVFLVMLVIVLAVARSERKARNASRPADVPEPELLAVSNAVPLPEETITTQEVLSQEQAATLPIEKPKEAGSSRSLTAQVFGRWSILQPPDPSTRADLLRRWAFLLGGVLVIVAVLPVFIGFHERRFQTLRHKGWTTYLQELHHEDARTLCWYFQGAKQGDLILDTQGRVWSAGGCSGLAGLHVFDGVWNSRGGNYRDLAAAPDGRLWAVSATGGSLDVLDGERWKTYSLQELGLPDHPITRVEVDPDGRVWVITRDDQPTRTVERIHEFTLSSQGVPSLKNSVSLDGYLNSFTPDGQGAFWLSVDRSFPKAELTGVSRFDGETLQQLPGQAENHRHVAGTALDKSGRLWAVTRCGSLLTYNRQTWKTILDQEGFVRCAPSHIHGMVLDSQGRPWAWDLHNVYILDGSDWTLLTSENGGVAGEWIFGVMMDDSDRVWIGSSGGVSVAALPDAKPLPGLVVSGHRAVLYIKSWLEKGYWFFPAIVAALWLATHFNALPGVVLAVAVGLTVIGAGVAIDVVNKSAYGMLVYVGAIVTIGGMIGGFVGGLIDRRKKIAGFTTRWGLEMAVLGMFMGIGYCIYLWWRIMAG
jgi:hypothetical protein